MYYWETIVGIILITVISLVKNFNTKFTIGPYENEKYLAKLIKAIYIDEILIYSTNSIGLS